MCAQVICYISAGHFKNDKLDSLSLHFCTCIIDTQTTLDKVPPNTDFPYYGNSTMRTRACSPKSFPTDYCTSWPLHSWNLRLWPNSRPIGQNQYQFPSKSRQSRFTSATRVEDFSRYYPPFYGSRPLCKLSNSWHMTTGKGRLITRCTLCIKDTSLLQTLQRGPAATVFQRFHCTAKFRIWVCSALHSMDWASDADDLQM